MSNSQESNEVKFRAKDGKAHGPSGATGEYEQGGQPADADVVWVWDEATGRLIEAPRRDDPLL